MIGNLVLTVVSLPRTHAYALASMEDQQITKVVLLGHSFIKRLDRFMRENAEDANLRLHTDKFEVIIRARGGLRVPLLACALSRELDFEASNGLVFLQIGGNDIKNNCNISSIISAITSVAEYLIHTKDVRRVIIGQLFRRRPTVVGPMYNSHVININKGIEVWRKQSDCPISFWKHRGFWDPDMNYLANDGVHLNKNKYMRKYLQSIKSAVLHASRQ